MRPWCGTKYGSIHVFLYINFERRLLQEMYLWYKKRKYYKTWNTWFCSMENYFFAFRALKIAFYHGNVFFIIVFVVEKEVDQWLIICKNRKTRFILFQQLQTWGKSIVVSNWLIVGKMERRWSSLFVIHKMILMQSWKWNSLFAVKWETIFFIKEVDQLINIAWPSDIWLLRNKKRW